MATFSDAEQFYTCMGAVFARMAQQDPGAGQAISRTGMILRLTMHDPPAQITLDGRHSPVQTIFRVTPLQPDLEVAMSAHTLHRILLGQLSAMSALGAGQLKVRGPVLRALSLGELFHRMQAVYPDVLREQGLG
jgi:putative sterol carrier protein